MSEKNLLIGFIIIAGLACTSSIQTGQAPENGKIENKQPKSAVQKSGTDLNDSDTNPESEHPHPEPKINDNESGKSTGTTTSNETSPSGPKVVEFTIPAGTGSKAWNSASNPIRVRQGDTLVVKNEDSRMHWIHTTFSPFPHPFQGIPSGQSARYQIRGSNASGMRDHLTLAPIYMTVTR
jgi:hypothetical protein